MSHHQCNMLPDEDDPVERTLTTNTGNPIEYRSDGKQRQQQPRSTALDHRNQSAAAIDTDGGLGAGHGYPSPSLSFSHFLQTKHDSVIFNCKEAGKTLAKYSRVDVDIYVSPLCYDYQRGTPTVSFKHKPKNFHINVLVPGNLPKPPHDRPPYGLGVEVSLESLSLRHPNSPSPPLRRSVRHSAAATLTPSKDNTANSKLPPAANPPKKSPAKQAAMAPSPTETKLSTRGQKRASLGAPLTEVATSKRSRHLLGN